MEKKLILAGLISVAVCGLVAWPLVAQRMERARRVAIPQQHLAAFHASKDWQAKAKAFNRNKSSAAAVFAGATKVESFRLFPSGQEKPIGKITNFSYFAAGATQGNLFAARLGVVILDAKTYPWPGQSIKQCYFEPSVAFRIWKNAQFVDTIICFGCSQLAVLENNPKVPQRSIGGSVRGKFHVAGDFDSARAQVMALTKEVFPDDAAIQALG